MGGNNRRGNPAFRVGRTERNCLRDEEEEGARHRLTDGQNMGRRVTNLPAIGPEHVQLSGKEKVFSEPEKHGNSSSYFISISLLDVAGKIYERLLAKRIKQHLALKGGLSGTQYGFIVEKSTIEAKEMQLIGMTIGDSRQTKEKCVVMALDVKSAFNTVAWTAIKKEMEHWDSSGYLK